MIESDYELVDALGATMEFLTERERQVLILRFGLDGNKEHTLEEVGGILFNYTSQHIGMSKDRVRQIEAKAFRKLRHPSRSGQLREFLKLDSNDLPVKKSGHLKPDILGEHPPVEPEPEAEPEAKSQFMRKHPVLVKNWPDLSESEKQIAQTGLDRLLALLKSGGQ
jgi:DNA-binding CsgD family transcriptional regulator